MIFIIVHDANNVIKLSRDQKDELVFMVGSK